MLKTFERADKMASRVATTKAGSYSPIEPKLFTNESVI